jgi:tetratricopeptide (TPR) repeat protein
LTPERWRQIEQVFNAALERPPAERSAYLTQACGSDDALRQEVESLLAQEIADDFIDVPIRGAARSVTQQADDSRVGQRLGAYRVTSLIGHGGMGAVYQAVRDDDQYQKQVALKLVKRGMDTESILQRFRHERQILASLEHTHIARLLDGGTTEDGLPYLVMEYIEGRVITAYCTDRRLPIADRLRLFLQVCAAVGYAHQKLVVHRDLKPSNILVTEEGVPKLLDFGIAKLLTPDLSSEAAPRTVTELRMMTPDYASPEQVRGVGITTAADIYSLGAVLYELLSGERPHRFKGYTPSEIERVICETETERPSRAVTRTTGASKLCKQLDGDLDNIVLMAMRKEPERRYSSVEQFAEDIRRHLGGRPVIARQDTFGYRSGKFVRRHKLGLTATALVILSLLGGIAMTAYQARRAERRFQQVRRLANTFLFDFYGKIRDLPGSTEAREAVAKTGLEYLDSLALEAKGDPGLQIELAEGYQRLAEVQGGYRIAGLDQFDAALASFRKALALGQDLISRDPRNTRALSMMIRSYSNIADFQRGRGDMASAPATIREALRLVDQLEAQPDLSQEELLVAINLFHFNGDLELAMGSSQAAEQSYRRALRLDERLSARFPGARAQHSLSLNMTTLGDALAARGDLNGAMDLYRKALGIRLDNVRQNPDNARYRRELALLYDWMGNYSGGPFNLNLGDRDAAEQHYRQCLAIEEELAAHDAKNVQGQMDLAFGYEHVANVLIDTDPAQAAALYAKGLAVLRPLLEKLPNELRYLRRQATQRRQMAVALQRRGERRGASGQMREAVEQSRALLAERPTNETLKADLFASLMASAELLLQMQESREASEQLHEALLLAEHMTKARPTDLAWQWRLADAYSALARYQAETLGGNSKLDASRRLAAFREACSWRRKALAVWDDWSRKAVSSAFNTARREQADRALAQCDAALGRLRAAAGR